VGRGGAGRAAGQGVANYAGRDWIKRHSCGADAGEDFQPTEGFDFALVTSYSNVGHLWASLLGMIRLSSVMTPCAALACQLHSGMIGGFSQEE